MPTFHDPRADADEASEALRGFAHASRVFDNPAETYSVLGDLLSGVRSLRQVLDQLGSAHLVHRGRARTAVTPVATPTRQVPVGAEPDWFAGPARPSWSAGQGLSL